MERCPVCTLPLPCPRHSSPGSVARAPHGAHPSGSSSFNQPSPTAATPPPPPPAATLEGVVALLQRLPQAETDLERRAIRGRAVELLEAAIDGGAVRSAALGQAQAILTSLRKEQQPPDGEDEVVATGSLEDVLRLLQQLPQAESSVERFVVRDRAIRILARALDGQRIRAAAKPQAEQILAQIVEKQQQQVEALHADGCTWRRSIVRWSYP
jgi:hypothetical protein